MSVKPNNRGGMGWQEPPAPDYTTEVKAFIRRAPPAADEIVMVEIDGVWMSPADAHEARLAIGRRA